MEPNSLSFLTTITKLRVILSLRRETRVSPSRAPVFSCAHYFQAPATQAKSFCVRRSAKYRPAALRHELYHSVRLILNSGRTSFRYVCETIEQP